MIMRKFSQKNFFLFILFIPQKWQKNTIFEMRRNVGKCGEMWGNVEKCGEMLGNVEKCGEMWGKANKNMRTQVNKAN